jgi:hypothetical protein
MAHFAKVVDGVVTQVIKAEPEFFDTFVDNSAGEWIQTSYNTRGGVHYDPETQQPDNGVALRKNFAGIGMLYDSERDAFYTAQPFPSWLLNEDTCLWEAPTPYPTTGDTIYAWDEDSQAWVIPE